MQFGFIPLALRCHLLSLLVLNRPLMRTLGWILIFMGSVSIGIDIIPGLYLVLFMNVQPGTPLPDSEVLSIYEYLKILVIAIGVIFSGFLIKDFSRIRLWFKNRSSVTTRKRG